MPCVVQDFATGEVLTLAYMNEEALRLTLETGEMHFYSRSREEIWHKGETSGNVQRLRQLRYDCDGDALVALVEPAGPACHTGERSCFYRELEGSADRRRRAAAPGEPRPSPTRRWPRSSARCAAAPAERPDGSYTVELLDDPKLIGEKVEEEAEEVVRAAREESDERVAEEAADVLYHLSVLLLSRGVSMADGDGGAQWPSCAERGPSIAASSPSLEQRPRARRARATSSRSATRFVDDSETPVSRLPEAARGDRARASCSSRPSRAASAATPSSASARARCCAGATGSLSEWSGDGDRGEPRRRDQRGARPLRRGRRVPRRATSSPRSRGCRRSPAARSASSATTWCARSSRSASRTPTRSGCPTWR